jgi:centriolar protein POC1
VEPVPQTTPLEATTVSPELSNTLLHIVGQLDILTQTMAILEERLTVTEDKVKECLDNQQRITLQIQPHTQ